MKRILSVVALVAILCMVAISCNENVNKSLDDADAYRCWEISYQDNGDTVFIEYKWASKTQIDSYVASVQTENCLDIQCTPVPKYGNIDDCQNADWYYIDEFRCWKVSYKSEVSGEVTMYHWDSGAHIEGTIKLLEKLGYTDITCVPATKYKSLSDCQSQNE